MSSARNPARPRRSGAPGVDYTVFDLTDDQYRGFYVGHANGVLWPLFHFRLGLLTYDRQQAEVYRDVNREFARRLLPHLRLDDTILGA